MSCGAHYWHGVGTRADACFTIGSNAEVRATAKQVMKTIRTVLITGIRSCLASFVICPDIFKNENFSFRYKNPVSMNNLSAIIASGCHAKNKIGLFMMPSHQVNFNNLLRDCIAMVTYYNPRIISAQNLIQRQPGHSIVAPAELHWPNRLTPAPGPYQGISCILPMHLLD